VIPFTQVSKEINILYNPNLAVGSRLISLTINGKPIEADRVYTLAATDYMLGGGDNQLPAVSATEVVVLDTLDEVHPSFAFLLVKLTNHEHDRFCCNTSIPQAPYRTHRLMGALRLPTLRPQSISPLL
jgi:hypothetical protein